ncbi:hypothetical protein VTL71DRAFT_4721 [Oculimacula yallundae]|uniref:Uncharacterized protein n=1 Tax=Oculimacula yallundae TaxID=86028 RepID=A0ABR4C3E6_9HELO
MITTTLSEISGATWLVASRRITCPFVNPLRIMNPEIWVLEDSESGSESDSDSTRDVNDQKASGEANTNILQANVALAEPEKVDKVLSNHEIKCLSTASVEEEEEVNSTVSEVHRGEQPIDEGSPTSGVRADGDVDFGTCRASQQAPTTSEPIQSNGQDEVRDKSLDVLQDDVPNDTSGMVKAAFDNASMGSENHPNLASSSAHKTLVSSEPLIPPQEILLELKKRSLDSWNETKFAYQEQDLKNAPNPGLYLAGHGMVGFPLSDADIDRIRQANTQPALGELGSEAGIEYLNSRSTWEVLENCWEVRNSEWDSYLTSIADRMHQGLDLKSSLMLSKGSLVLYGPNAKVTSNDLIESVSPETIGTLEIALPSSHSAFVTYFVHGGRIKSFPVSRSSEYSCSCLAWLSGITLASDTLVSGYRLVLRYPFHHMNPGRSRPEILPMPSLEYEAIRLARLLHDWNQQLDKFPRKYLAHVFETRLEEDLQSCSVSDFRGTGSDRYIFNRLQTVCRAAGFYFCIAKLTVTTIESIEDGEDEEDSEDEDEDYRGYAGQNSYRHERQEPISESPSTAEAFTDSDDIRFYGKLTKGIADGHILNDGRIDDIGANETVEDDDDKLIRNYYERKVAIFMPRMWKGHFFLNNQGPAELSELLDEFITRPISHPASSTFQDDIRELCFNYVKEGSWSLPSNNQYTPLYARLFKAVCMLNDPQLIGQALPFAFTSQDAYNTFSSVVDPGWRVWLLQSLKISLDEIKIYETRMKAIEKIAKYMDDSEWLHAQHVSALSIFQCSSAADGEQLANMANSWIEDPALEDLIKTTVQKYAGEPDFILSFLAALPSGSDKLKAMFGQFVPYSEPHLNPIGRTATSNSISRIARILAHCYELRFWSEVDRLISIILGQAAKTSEMCLETFYMPFLVNLGKLIGNSKGIRFPLFQKLYKGILMTGINRIPEPPNQAGQNWSRPTHICHEDCLACTHLNAFLANPNRVSDEFKYSLEVRNHLESQMQKHLATGALQIQTNWNRPLLHSLIVHKIVPGSQQKARKREQQCFKLKGTMSNIGAISLMSLLSEHYGNMIELRPPTNVSSARNRMAIPASRSKIVDLTSSPPAIGPSTAPSRANSGSAQNRQTLSHHKRPLSLQGDDTRGNISAIPSKHPRLQGPHDQIAKSTLDNPGTESKLRVQSSFQLPPRIPSRLNILRAKYPDDIIDVVMENGLGFGSGRIMPYIKCNDCGCRLFVVNGTSLHEVEAQLNTPSHNYRVASVMRRRSLILKEWLR